MAWASDTPEEVDVLVRWGSKDPAWERWRRFAGIPVTEVSQAAEFIERLGQHRILAVRTYPSEAEPVTVMFDLRDAGRVVEEATNACKAFAERMEDLEDGRAKAHRQADAERRQRDAERERIEAASTATEAALERIEAAKKRAEKEIGRIEAAKRKAKIELKWLQAARGKQAERALREAMAWDPLRLERERRALFDAGRIEYIARIKAKIEHNWLAPPGVRPGLKCVVRVSQIPGGEVVQAEIQTSSGSVAFDRSVEDAVLRSSPLPVPKDPSLFDRNIVIKFEPEG